MEKITDKIAALPQGSSHFSLEFFPPKTQEGFNNLLPRLHRLRALRPLFITVTWGAGGSTASKSLELARVTQKQLGLTTCLHLTCTNMRRRILDDALERCKELGVRNILALRGDEPREGEYDIPDLSNGTSREVANGHNTAAEGGEEELVFKHAVDLVRYIRRKHGSYFCIGVAAYPEGHSTSPYDPSRSPENDVPFLIEKVRAGADFIMTQLFYDVDAFLRFEDMLRGHDSGVFKDTPIIPGLMPVQSWGILTRTSKLACATVPLGIMTHLEKGKGDDEKVKQLGVDALQEIVDTIKSQHVKASQAAGQGRRPQGFHFYTLNLEKAVAQILERCDLIPPPASSEVTNGDTAIASDDDETVSAKPSTNGHVLDGVSVPPKVRSTKDRRRLSSANSAPRNRVVVPRHRASQSNATFEALDDEAGVPREKSQSRANALAISEGEGSLGREATWDDYPNGRWGDARSPAYGSIDGYGPSLHVTASAALDLWSYPTTPANISSIFRRYLTGELSAVPWSEEALSAETALIRDQLLALNEKDWWTVASQPAVNAGRSDDSVVGWGPKVGGWVWQKPFVEFFIPTTAWTHLRARLDAATPALITYFAANASGTFVSNSPDSVNPVTWGSFKGKEIITPTQISALSFRAWRDEAFALWDEWRRVYAEGSASAKLLGSVGRDVWLVNVIGHEFLDGGEAFWSILLGDG